MTMSEALMTMMLNAWLVLAFILFLVILYRTFRPSARKAMNHNSMIPFALKDETDGNA